MTWAILAFLLISVVGLGYLAGITEKVYFEGTEMSSLNALLSLRIFEWKDIGLVSVPVPNTEWMGVLGQAVLWDYSMFATTWGFPIRMILMAGSAALVILMVIELGRLIRGT